MNNRTIAERLRSGLEANKAVGRVGDSWDNHLVAYETVQDELGFNHPSEPIQSYDEFSDEVRDRLLVNGRQDTAHALSNTTSLLKRQRQTYLLVWISIVLNLVVVAMLFKQMRG